MAKLALNKAPLDGDTHTWADYVELLALLNMDGVCTADAAVDRILDADAIDEDVVDDEEEVDSGVQSPGDGRSKRVQQRGRVGARVFDAFELIAWRANTYGDAYSFGVAGDKRSVTLRAHLSPANYLYIFLLLAANLRFVASGRSQLTDKFEEVALRVMKEVLPRGADVHVFGKATAQRYVGTAFEKIRALSDDIRASLFATPESYRIGDSGDSGIDLVGWQGLSDQQKNILVYFGQCACSRSDWTKKQLSASPDSLGSQLHTIPRWVTLMFVPVCFRRVGGEWAVDSDVASVVFFDRLRLLRNCSDFSAFEGAMPGREIVDSFLAEKEELV